MQNVHTYISLSLVIIIWELLATETGFFIWGCSILMGLILYLSGRKNAVTRRFLPQL
ncbi:hypothetical protein CHCC10893_1443 [Bacillus licheniformis]|nr:hypothetical protein CHCC20323_2974 [Bacillus licheniformis]TWN73025.1 hypothetical protein CHCC10893_1443 [Bacillus licheniformis]